MAVATPSDNKTFMSSIRRGMIKTFEGQAKLREKVEEQNERLEWIEEGLWHSQAMGQSTSAGSVGAQGDIMT